QAADSTPQLRPQVCSSSNLAQRATGCRRLGLRSWQHSSWFIGSLCNLCVLCASVVKELFEKTTTETQRTQRLHRENQTSSAKLVLADYGAATRSTAALLKSCVDQSISSSTAFHKLIRAR